jgi:hypothetical protein
MDKELANVTADDDAVKANETDSDYRAVAGEGEIKSYDEVIPDHSPLEDKDEISSTDDV